MVTLARALDFLGITNPTATQQDLLELFIELVGSEIEAYTNRVLIQRATSETLTFGTTSDMSHIPEIEIISGALYSVLSETPVSALTLTDDNGAIAASRYKLFADTGVIRFEGGTPTGDVTASYTAGFDPIPADLQLVALQGIRQYWSESGAVAQGSGNVKSKSLDRFSVSYGQGNQTYTAGGNIGKTYLEGNSSILDRYTKFRVWG